MCVHMTELYNSNTHVYKFNTLMTPEILLLLRFGSLCLHQDLAVVSHKVKKKHAQSLGLQNWLR